MRSAKEAHLCPEKPTCCESIHHQGAPKRIRLCLSQTSSAPRFLAIPGLTGVRDRELGAHDLFHM